MSQDYMYLTFYCPPHICVHLHSWQFSKDCFSLRHVKISDSIQPPALPLFLKLFHLCLFVRRQMTPSDTLKIPVLNNTLLCEKSNNFKQFYYRATGL